jgi:hypothetical protein
MAIWYLYRYYDFCLVLKSGVEVPVFNENYTCIFFILDQVYFRVKYQNYTGTKNPRKA